MKLRYAPRPWLPIVASVALLTLAVHTPNPARADGGKMPFIDRIAWLAGCWGNSFDNGAYEEQWMAPKGGMMLGMSRTVVADQAVEFEQIRIVEQNNQLLYIPKPSGQEETIFRCAQLTDSLVIFMAPEHDFPQRICYQRNPDGSLLAWIDGKKGDKEGRIEFPMQRRSCP